MFNIKIDDIDYPGYTNEEPDIYTKIEDIKNIDYYYKIDSNDYELIERSKTIYYTIDEARKYYSSGCVVKYIKPDTFILKNTKYVQGKGSSKKEAEQSAAETLIKLFKI